MTPSGIVALACAVVNFAGAGLDVTSAVRSGEVIAFLTAATADGPSTSRPSTAGTTSKVPFGEVTEASLPRLRTSAASPALRTAATRSLLS